MNANPDAGSARFPPGKALAAAAAAVVIAAVAAGLFLIDGPATERAHRLDRKRVDNLHKLATKIDCYWTLEQRLPEDFAAMRRLLGERSEAGTLKAPCLGSVAGDPETGKEYGYRKGKDGAFELCAAFAMASGKGRVIGGYGGVKRRRWKHPAGEYCFKRTAYAVPRLR